MFLFVPFFSDQPLAQAAVRSVFFVDGHGALLVRSAGGMMWWNVF
jgi:hypothetical protein